MPVAKLRWSGRHALFLHHILDKMREGKSIIQVAKELECTRAWVYLMLKEAQLAPIDFRWYRSKNLNPSTRRVASWFMAKHLKIRTHGSSSSHLKVLDEGRTPLIVAVHTVKVPRFTEPGANFRYFAVTTQRKGVTHLIPIDQEILVIAPTRSGQTSVPSDPYKPTKTAVPICKLADIEILEVIRANIRR
jgi:hypothetical protein